jgi:hypothetical protein
LHLVSTEARVARLQGRSPATVRKHLWAHSDRWNGARAVDVRRRPVPAAYRSFFRHIGLDPEVLRTPIEQAALARMLQGGFLSKGLLDDALLIALIDTGVPVWALDADTVEGPLGIRVSREDEPLGRSSRAWRLPAGRLVVADSVVALAILFGQLAHGHEPGGRTRRLALFAVQVAGVPRLYVDEALWTCRSALETA